ncbi:MAG: TonB-dependent receptor [Bacteroidales bacterium]|nr:TonB-dependent receptor [Bacteroidales bacterium]
MKVSFTWILLIIACSITPLLYGQQRSLRGVVISAIDEEPLIGVSVVEKGTKNGVITDINGAFTITTTSKNPVLEFRYLGYASQTVEVRGNKELTIKMGENTEQLDEVVVVGYGTVKKSDLTGAITSVKSEDIVNTASSSVDVALQGKVSGVNIVKKSGRPGETADIKIRGIGTFGDSNPLWIIDGVQQSPGNQLNMNDVEHIEVLKDASAAAIYGSEAANGVIIVTTKRGKKGDAKVSFNGYVGGMFPTNLPNLLDSKQLKTLRIEDFNGKGGMTYQEMLNYDLSKHNASAYALDFEPTNADYGWKDLLFSNGLVQNYDVSLSKGSDKFNYYAAFNYYDEGGTYIDTHFKRFSFRFNSDVTMKDWLKFGESLQLTYTNRNTESDPRYLEGFMRVLPFMMPYDETNQPGGFGYFPKDVLVNGEPYDIKSNLAGYDGGNPLADELTNKGFSKDYTISGNIYADIQPLKQLNIRATFGGDFGTNNSGNRLSRYSYYPPIKEQLAVSMNENLSLGYSLLSNIVATYDQTFGEHHVRLMAGFEARQGNGVNVNGSAKNMFGDKYTLNSASTENRDVSGSYNEWSSMSYFARLNYDYKDRYLFTAVVRSDGSDKFIGDYKWGTFPSFSAAWKIKEEAFLRDVDWLSVLKLRASWGMLGNNRTGSFLYTSNYTTDNAHYAYGPGGEQMSYGGVRLSRLPNKDIRWETVTTTDVGVDVAFLRNSLTFSVDWYVKNTTDALFQTTLPSIVGLGHTWATPPNYTVNVGEIRNMGMDFEAGYRGNVGRDFSYNIGANWGFFKNEVLKTNEEGDVLISGSVLGGTNISYTMTGLPMAAFYAYKTDGVFQNQAEVDAANAYAAQHGWTVYQETGTAPGDLKYVDVNGDGHITADDITHVGNPWPKFMYGFNIGFSYKFLDFGAFFQGVVGNKIFNSFRSKTHTLYQDFNTTEYALNRWTGEGSTNEYFRQNVDDPNGNERKASTWFLEDGSYLRLKNVQIGLTLPSKWTKKAKIQKCRFYVSGQNLLTFTRYQGFDPELAGDNTSYGIDGGNYPQNRSVMGGVQVEF